MLHKRSFEALSLEPFLLVLLAVLSSQIIPIVECGCGQRDGYICRYQESCGRSYAKRGYVIDGQDVGPYEFPSFAQMATNRGVCSGVIVSDRHILTAAHCLVPEISDPQSAAEASEIRIYVGTHINVFKAFRDGLFGYSPVEARTVSRYCLHPEYLKNDNYDQAVLVLDEPLNFDDSVQPACWPYEQERLNTGEDSYCFLVGAGYVNTSWLAGQFEVHVQKGRVRGVPCNWDWPVACFKGPSGETSCFGDSGGPIYCLDQYSDRWFVAGTVIGGLGSKDTCESGDLFIIEVPTRDMAQLTSDSSCGYYFHQGNGTIRSLGSRIGRRSTN